MSDRQTESRTDRARKRAYSAPLPTGVKLDRICALLRPSKSKAVAA